MRDPHAMADWLLPAPFETALLADRAALWRTVARGLSHDLANASQMLSIDPPPSSGLHEARERVTRSAQVLAAMGRHESGRPPCVATEVAEGLLGLHALQTGFPGVQLEWTLEPGLPALNMASADLEHVLLSLATNAKQSGARHLRLQAHHAGAFVLFVLHDDGPGWPAGAGRERFRPGWSTRGATHLGLGLVVARGLMERAGGSLEVPPSDSGACLAVHVPAVLR